MVKVTILGCGASLGVPIIGCKCKTCSSDSNFNKRTRSSVLFTKDGKNVLVDFGLDVRSQLVRESVDNLECAILTHDHADHIGGIDDLRVYSRIRGSPLPIYSDADTIDIVRNRYTYLLNEKHIELRPLADFETIETMAGMDIQFFRQDHRDIDSLGIRIGDFVYTNDVIRYPDESKKYLENAKIWVIDCIDHEGTDAHLGLKDVLKLVDEYKPEMTYLVNMSHFIDYFEIQKELPENIKPSYDGMVLNIDE